MYWVGREESKISVRLSVLGSERGHFPQFFVFILKNVLRREPASWTHGWSNEVQLRDHDQCWASIFNTYRSTFNTELCSYFIQQRSLFNVQHRLCSYLIQQSRDLLLSIHPASVHFAGISYSKVVSLFFPYYLGLLLSTHPSSVLLYWISDCPLSTRSMLTQVVGKSSFPLHYPHRSLCTTLEYHWPLTYLLLGLLPVFIFLHFSSIYAANSSRGFAAIPLFSSSYTWLVSHTAKSPYTTYQRPSFFCATPLNQRLPSLNTLASDWWVIFSSQLFSSLNVYHSRVSLTSDLLITRLPVCTAKSSPGFAAVPLVHFASISYSKVVTLYNFSVPILLLCYSIESVTALP